ncbi:hypothetical protein [Streptomyces sp. NPDC057460]|uniref:hypothetical protein n=1 Tax=Streptomyces sp. NPDC057460 TaxID=3346141 RepID=UPI0036C62B67
MAAGAAASGAGTSRAVLEDPAEADQRLVQILAAGLKDETAARRLGLGVPTIRRRIAAVMEQLDATTRFQVGYLLGLRAAATSQQDSP